MAQRRKGEVADYSRACGEVEAKLFGFGIDSVELCERHLEWLSDFVVPILADGGSVSLVGETSRSGSGAHNQALSEKRASAVLDYLRRTVHAPLRSRFEVKSVIGVGERSAAQAGSKDGTEDAFYRAVRVRAWSRPVPPPAPGPQSTAPKTVQRVISREWSSVNTRTLGGGNPYHDGEAGALLADLVNKWSDTAKRGGSDTRTYSHYPPEYVVVRVHDSFTIDDSLKTGFVNTTRYLQTIEYEWGERTPSVTLFKKTTTILFGGTRKVERSTQIHPRAIIWKHVTAPDAKVFG